MISYIKKVHDSWQIHFFHNSDGLSCEMLRNLNGYLRKGKKPWDTGQTVELAPMGVAYEKRRLT